MYGVPAVRITSLALLILPVIPRGRYGYCSHFTQELSADTQRGYAAG